MANRSYLYSCNVIPGENENEKELIGISEWNYDIPIVFKLLLSGDPKICESSIWDVEEKIAIVGKYEEGLKNLDRFFDLIEREDAQPLVLEAREFLNDVSNQRKYFVLECGEIFDMIDIDLEGQNQELLGELLNLENSIDQALASIFIPNPIKQGLFQRLLFPKAEKPKKDSLNSVYALGLGNWSNILYFDFSKAPEENTK